METCASKLRNVSVVSAKSWVLFEGSLMASLHTSNKLMEGYTAAVPEWTLGVLFLRS